LDRAGANPETNYVSASYTAGTTSVPLQIATQFSHAQNSSVEWDQHVALGPGLGGFLPDGVGIEEEALWDPVSLLYYVERSATQDNAVSPNVVLESEALFNAFGNNGMERARSVLGKALFNGAGANAITTPGAGGAVTLTFTSDPSTAAVGALKAGMQVTLWNPGSPPTNIEVVTVLASYTSGTSVPITTTQITHPAGTIAFWEGFGAVGPGLNGFMGTGMDVDEDCVFDPVSQLYYIERSATADTMSAQNIVAESPALFNGAAVGVSMDRARSGSAANLSAFSATGSELTTTPGNWTVLNTPAAATQATATKAAGAAGVRHVCNSISATFAAGATPGAATLVNLRDGASGAGTILWSQYLAAPTGDVRVLTISGLNIVGSAATAMTLEFAAAGAATTLQAVTLTGYDTV
jgi:hypothetical protein